MLMLKRALLERKMREQLPTLAQFLCSINPFYQKFSLKALLLLLKVAAWLRSYSLVISLHSHAVRANTIILIILFTFNGKWRPCILENYCRYTFARTRPHISLLSLGKDGRVESVYEDNYQSKIIDVLINNLRTYNHHNCKYTCASFIM